MTPEQRFDIVFYRMTLDHPEKVEDDYAYILSIQGESIGRYVELLASKKY